MVSPLRQWAAVIVAGCWTSLWTFSANAQPPQKYEPHDTDVLNLHGLSTLLGGGTRITVQSKEAALDEVLDSARRQTGVSWRLGSRSAPRGPLNLNIREQRVWTLFDALRGQMELVKRTSDSSLANDAVPVTASAYYQPWATLDLDLLQMRVAPPRVTRKTWVLPLSLFLDPKIQPVAGTTRLKILEATDEKGNDVLGETRLTSWVKQYPLIWLAYISQPRSDDMGIWLAKLRGVLQFSVVTRSERWEVQLGGDLPVEKVLRNNEWTEIFSIDALGPAKDIGNYEVTATRIRRSLIHPRFWNATELYRAEIYSQSLLSNFKILDAQGREFSRVRVSVNGDLDDAVSARTVTAQFSRAPREGAVPAPEQQPQGEPAKLIWEIPCEIRTVEIPFEFTDLPLMP